MQRDLAAECLDAVLEPDQAGAVAEAGAAAPVVADADVQEAVAGGHLDIGDGGVPVLGRVGQRLGDRVVGGELDRLGQPILHLDVQADRDRGAAGQRLQRRAQPALGQDRWMETAGDLAQLLQRAGHLGDRAVQLPRQLTGPGGCGRLRLAQLQGQGDQALLGAVVQITLDAAPGGIGGGHDPRPRGGQLVTAVGVRARGTEQLGKLRHPLFHVGRR
ncbi:MAG TPA: hypothetical protein VE733_08280 [Streptosporangiaceae bacterium]|nr:hypothetical protein [Streptosporangiaceae bacterium]